MLAKLVFTSDVRAVVKSVYEKVQQNLNKGVGGNGCWKSRSGVTTLMASG
jgi:hypothetical protein